MTNSTSGSGLRIGAVSYLNTKPLVYHLERHLPEAKLSFDLPSRLADQLARGQLDVALIPSVEFYRSTGYEIVSDACIACRGPVLSVKLLSRVDPARVKTLALDEGSRTSVALVRILLKEKYNVTPELTTLAIDQDYRTVDTDAVLVIGDRAIHTDADGFVLEADLGQTWVEWSGLPFVFATWVGRANGDHQAVAAALEASRDEGLANLAEIARAECGTVRLDEETSLAYLRDNLHFRLGERERQGLELYFEHVGRLESALASN